MHYKDVYSYIETPSSLDVEAMCWSDHYRDTTGKFLLAISPKGQKMYVSSVYGGCITRLSPTVVKNCDSF